MTPTQPPNTHTHPTPYLGGCEEDLSKKTAPDGTNTQTNTQTDGHGNSMTESAQWADSVKIVSKRHVNLLFSVLFIELILVR